MASRRNPPPPPDFDAILERARSLVREQGSAKLSALKVPKSHQAELIERLVATGLEVNKSIVRRPVSAQLTDELATGAYLPLATIATRLSGVSPADAKQAALRIVAEGKAFLASRAGKDVLVPSGSDILRAQDLAALTRALDATLRVARKAARADRCLLRQDLNDSLGQFVGAPGTPIKTSRPIDRVGTVIEASQRLLDPRLGLAFVPAVVRAVASECDTRSAHAVLHEASRAGLIELRPESGLGRLSREDEALCLPGPQGMILSWIRVVDQEKR